MPSASRNAVSMRSGSAKLFLIVPQVRGVGTHRAVARVPAERPRAARPVAADDPLGACGVDERGVDPGELGELPGQRAQRHGDAVLEREGRRGVAPHVSPTNRWTCPSALGRSASKVVTPGRQRQPLGELPDEVLVAERDLGLHAGQAELRREQGEPDEPSVQARGTRGPAARP